MTQTRQSAIAFFITADQLTEGDIVNYNNDILCLGKSGFCWGSPSRINTHAFRLVASEPEYRVAGITFDAIYLEVRSPNTQALSIAPVLESRGSAGVPPAGLIPPRNPLSWKLALTRVHRATQFPRSTQQETD